MKNNNNNTIDAIDKMRNIINWVDYQNEDFNCKIRSISDIEKVYNYAIANDLEFVDNLPYNDYYTPKDNFKHSLAINKMLGYKLYDIEPISKATKNYFNKPVFKF